MVINLNIEGVKGECIKGFEIGTKGFTIQLIRFYIDIDDEDEALDTAIKLYEYVLSQNDFDSIKIDLFNSELNSGFSMWFSMDDLRKDSPECKIKKEDFGRINFQYCGGMIDMIAFQLDA